MIRPCHICQYIQIWMSTAGRALTDKFSFDLRWFTVAEALTRPPQHSFRAKVEDRLKALPQDVGLAFGVVVHVAGSQLPVQCQIPRCSSGLDAQPRNQILMAYLSDETHP